MEPQNIGILKECRRVVARRGKKPAKRTNEMDPSIPSYFLKIVFMDQTVHLMVIVYVVSQLSLSVTNITAALPGGSAAL